MDSRKDIKKLIGRETSGIGMPASNSVIELSGVASSCHKKYGRGKMLQLWKTGSVERSLGMDINELETKWEKKIGLYPIESINYLDKIGK